MPPDGLSHRHDTPFCCLIIAIVAGAVGGHTVHAAESSSDRPPEVAVTVHAQQVTFNGRTALPMGMLGVHNVPLDEERVADWGVTGVRLIHHNPGGVTRIPDAGARARLQAEVDAATDRKERRRLQRRLDRLLPHTLSWAMDCFYDRYQPALQISHPTDWEERLRNAVRSFVSNARESGQQHYLEFWNEPYLNWATSPAVNYSPRYYMTDGVQPGDPMVLRETGEAVPGLVWGDQRFWVRERGQINYVIRATSTQAHGPGSQRVCVMALGERCWKTAAR